MNEKKPVITKKRVYIAIAAILFVIYLWYTRPMTVEQHYPYLDLSGCVGVTVWYIDDNTNGVSDILTLSAEESALFVELFEGRTFRRTPGSILPQRGRTHRLQPGDFHWSVLFLFDNVTLPDGSVDSRVLLQVDNYWGKVSIVSGSKSYHSLTTADKDVWLREVLDAIYAAEAA